MTRRFSSARLRRAGLLLLVLSPLVLGGWRSDCSRSVGVWPNYIWDATTKSGRYQGGEFGGSESASLEHTDGTGIAHIMLFVGWTPDLYDCSKSPCKFAIDSNGHSKLYNFVYNGVHTYAALNLWRQYNVSVVLNVHQRYGSTQVGPDFLQPGGALAPNNSTITTAFNKFYDEIYSVMQNADFRDPSGSAGAVSWAISIGNEVDNFLNVSSASQTATNWSQYQSFATSANTHIKTTNSSSLTLLTGVCMTYYGSALPALSNTSHPALAMHTVGDLVIITYYPIVNCGAAPNLCPKNGAGGGVRMGEPNAPSLDFPVMVQYLSSVNSKRSAAGVASSYVFLQEVGYPTQTGGVAAGDLACPDSAGTSCNPTNATTTLETDQAQFIDNLFQQFNANTSTIRGFSYWSLFDYTPYSQQGCSPLWPASATRFCYMGLRHGDGTAKPAFTNFRSQLSSFTP